MARKKKHKTDSCTIEKFISVWCKHYRKGSTINDVAEELGCAKKSISIRRHRLEKDGVILPKLKHGMSVRHLDRIDRARAVLEQEMKITTRRRRQ